MRLWMVDDPLRLLLVLLRIGVLPVMAALPVAAACIVCNRLLFKSADITYRRNPWLMQPRLAV